MKQRNIFVVMVLSFITLGIYMLFWLASTRKEMQPFGAQIPTIWLLAGPLLAFLSVFILSVITLARLISQSSRQSADGVVTALYAAPFVAVLFLIFVMIPLTIYWFYKYSKAVELVTQGKTSFELSFILFLVTSFFGLTFIWPGIIQDGFNDVPHDSQQPPGNIGTIQSPAASV